MRTVMFILFITLTTSAQTKSNTNSISDTFKAYRELIESKNYDKAFDYYHPSFLKYVPKEALEKEFSKLNSNPNYSYTVTDSEIVFLSKVAKQDSLEYVRLKYGANTRLKFYNNVSSESMEKTRAHFKKLYGDNYTFSEIDREIVTYKEQELIGIKNTSWKFVIYKDKLRPYMHLWVPENVLAALLSE